MKKKAITAEKINYTHNLWCTRITQVFSIVILAVFPLLIDRNRYVDITNCKERIWIFMAIAYWIVLFLETLGMILNQKVSVEKAVTPLKTMNLSQIIVLAYILWWVISALCSEWRADTWAGQMRGEGVRHILLYGITFFLVSIWGKFSEKYAYGVAIMAAAFSILALLQIFDVQLFYSEGVNFWNSGFLGTIGHIDMVAAIIAIGIPMLFCAFVLLETRMRYLCIFGMMFLTVIQVVSDVDSSKIGLISAFGAVIPFLIDCKKRCARTLFASSLLMGAFLLPYFLRFRRFDWEDSPQLTYEKPQFIILLIACLLAIFSWLLGRKKDEFKLSPKTIHWIAYTVIVVLVIILLCYVYNYSGDITILNDASTLFHGQLTERLGNGRGMIWHGALQIIKNNPIFGCGPGTYLVAMDPYNEWGSLETQYGTHVDFAHNDFLQIAACEGLVGLLIYLAFLVSVLLPAFKNIPRKPYAIILIAPIIAYLTHSFFSFSLSIVSPLFWVLMGLLNCCVKKE